MKMKRTKKTIAARRKVRAYKAAQVLKAGDRVRMPANRDEGWADETGTVIDVDHKHSVVTVRLDTRFFADVDDDGLRETGIEFCEKSQAREV